jgi:hypothetical protein
MNGFYSGMKISCPTWSSSSSSLPSFCLFLFFWVCVRWVPMREQQDHMHRDAPFDSVSRAGSALSQAAQKTHAPEVGWELGEGKGSGDPQNPNPNPNPNGTRRGTKPRQLDDDIFGWEQVTSGALHPMET